MAPIIFYFPYPTVGGVSVLFLRLAKQLVKKYEVILIDMEDGYMSRNIPKGVRYLKVGDTKMIPDDAVMVTQTCPPWRIQHLERFPRSLRLFFWNLHPLNIYVDIFSNESTYWLIRKLSYFNVLARFPRKKKLTRFLNLLETNKSIAFMDLENLEQTIQNLGTSLETSYLPICTEQPILCKTDYKTGRYIRLVWVGRLEDFKIPPLLHLLDRLNKIKNYQLQLTIIGQGGGEDVIREKSKKTDSLNVIFQKEVNILQLESELLNHDILFAMGTSALEGAKVKIPTFVVDYSFVEIKGNLRFRMLYEMEGLNLAEKIGAKHIEDKSTLEKRIGDVHQNMTLYGQRCFDYWQQHHSPEFVKKKLLDYLDGCSLTVGMLQDDKLLKPDIVSLLKNVLLNMISKKTGKYKTIPGWKLN
jgi:glycosyltransferase involved in cell wall biosynthesis